ncbi:MAG: hypothetical protein PHX68_01905 [Alphaproteobacteria bacterium]|nr:hypothetical protein [Alphaproteobacteria bacterium]
MAQAPFSARRLVLTGAAWLCVYFFVLLPAVSALLDFQFLDAAAWHQKSQDFMAYRWRIETGRDWALLGAMIAWIPMIFIGGWGFYRAPWHKLGRLVRRKSPARAIQKARLSRKTFVPHAVRGQYGLLRAAQRQPEQTQAQPSPPPKELDAMQRQIQDDTTDVQLLMELAQPFAADVFPYIVLNGRYASLAVSTESSALMVRIVGGDDQWSVDVQAPLEASDWYGSGKTLSAPAADLRQLSRDFKEQEPDSDIRPMMVLARGKLLNAAETRAYLEQNGILLARLDGAEPADIPLFTDVLKQHFQLKEGP